MSRSLFFTTSHWAQTVAQASAELTGLPVEDRLWLEARLAAIRDLQTAMDRLFRQAGGPELCVACPDCCCGCGRHHFTLTNLLMSLVEAQDPPVPDHRQTCPYLGGQGCRLAAAQRPYNCISFICDPVEGQLETRDRKAFYRLDELLRREYEAIAARYPVASLRGLLIAQERNGERPLLRPSALGSKLRP